MTGVALASTVAGAVLGGVYLAFDLAVIPSLVHASVGAAPDPAETMRSVNVAIVRPAFLALLFGAPAVAVVAAVASPSPLTIGAAVLQVGGLVVTIAVNVPLNDALAAGGTFEQFVGPWMVAHRVRTGAALLGAVVTAVSVRG